MFDEYTDIVTIDELQEMLRIGRSTAYKLLRSGQIKAIHSGRVWLIPKMSIIEYLANTSRHYTSVTTPQTTEIFVLTIQTN